MQGKMAKQGQLCKVMTQRVCLLLNPPPGNQFVMAMKKNPKASTSKNVHRVEEQVMENPEFLDDLALNSDDNANADAAEGQPMGTGITSRFN